MFEMTSAARTHTLPTYLAQPAQRPPDHSGLRALARMLDVVDYGILQVVEDGCVLFANQAARAEMNDDHPLQLLGQNLRARCPRDVVRLHAALSGALQRGMQAMLKLGATTGHAVHVAVVPLTDTGQPTAVIVLGRRRVCEDLSSDAYARQHGLTAAESRVLRHLCAGDRPQDIADMVGVKLSTVRTQIGSIRAKTDSRDIGAIVQLVARLPPLPCVTRRAA